MKHPEEVKDPLLAAIVEETSGITRIASAQVRARQRARHNATRAICALVFAFSVFGYWLTKLDRHPTVAVSPTPAKLTTSRQGYVRVHLPGEAITPEPLLADLSNHEKELLDELRDVPVLIVNNTRGEVTHVHVFER